MNSRKALVVAALLVGGPAAASADTPQGERQALMEDLCASYRRNAGPDWLTLAARYERRWGHLPPPLPPKVDVQIDRLIVMGGYLDRLCWGIDTGQWAPGLAGYPEEPAADGRLIVAALERCDQPLPATHPCLTLYARCTDRSTCPWTGNVEHLRCGGPVAAIATEHCRLVLDKSPAPPEVARRVPAPTPRDAAVDRWTVQVNATTNPQQARDLAGSLRAKGYEAYIVQAPVRGQVWHRLRVGSFTTRDEAVLLERRLKVDERLENAYVTPQ